MQLPRRHLEGPPQRTGGKAVTPGEAFIWALVIAGVQPIIAIGTAVSILFIGGAIRSIRNQHAADDVERSAELIRFGQPRMGRVREAARPSGGGPMPNVGPKSPGSGSR